MKATSLYGFTRDDLKDLADGLELGYLKTVNVGNTTGEGDEHLESATAAAARFIRSVLGVGQPPRNSRTECTCTAKDMPFGRCKLLAYDYMLLYLLHECREYLACAPGTNGGEPEAKRLVQRIDESLKT